MLDNATMFWRFARGLRRFTRSSLDPEQCRLMVEREIETREQTFLRLVKRSVYEFRRSPYKALLEWAGVEFGDLESMVLADGIESAMERLYDAGVHVGLEEFKGQRPIERRGLSIETEPDAFDNPLSAREIDGASGGSTGPRRRSSFEFELLTHEAANLYVVMAANGLETMPWALWRSTPPGAAGLKQAFHAAKLALPLARWFSPQPLTIRESGLQAKLLVDCSVRGSRGLVCRPEYVSLSDGAPVARWMASQVQAGEPAFLSAPATSVARICIAALKHGLDLSGSAFVVSGEPFTEAKRELVYSVGARSVSMWAMSEAGVLSGGCARREATDEVHLFRGKVAAFQRPKLLADGETEVNAILITTLLTATPKIMLNVDTGDFGVLRERQCGCLLGEIGFTHTLHTIRNYEKLTTAGMHFTGGSIIRLVEEALPAAHGGHPSDYQFVDEQIGELNRIRIVVSPRVGGVDEGAVIETVVRFMVSESDCAAMMGWQWNDGGLLNIVREEPYTTPAGKIPTLRTIRSDA
jgi:hypothetical protein